MEFKWDEFNGLEFFASVLITLILTYVVYRLKPSLIISSACWNSRNSQIHITIKNLSRNFDAVNLRIEVAAFDQNARHTFHLTVDHTDFLILPKKKIGLDNEKVFKVIGISKEAMSYLDENETLMSLLKNRQLRVRIHSYHSFSGLGKAEEKIFDSLKCS